MTHRTVSEIIMKIKVDEGKLISGKEAYRLIGDGVEIEAHIELKENLWQWEDAKHLPACDILNDGFDFRLKPRTITLNGIEVPAPFEPEDGQEYWRIHPSSDAGYCSNESTQWPKYYQFGAWRTEDEIKQVVAALRQVFGGSHDN